MSEEPTSLATTRYPALASGAMRTGRWAVIALGFSIPISVALDNVLLGVVALAWLAAGDWRAKFDAIRNNPVALAALALFGLLALGLAWGTRDPGDGLRYLGKYADLMFVPVFLTFFSDARTRERALSAFCLAALASIVVSHMVYLDLLADNPLLQRSPEYPGGFKLSITHGLLVAFAAYIFALHARADTSRMRRWCLSALALLAAHNVLFVVFGRTGYLVLAVLFVYFFAVTFGRRGVLLIAVISAASLIAAYTTSSTFQQRIDVSVQQFRNWQPGEPSATSVGSRLEWYSNSLKIIAGHPLLGAGTGSFTAAYAAAVRGTPMAETTNPHNEYLLITIQLGLVGLACLVYLFYVEWRLAAQLAPLYRDLARGLVLMMVTGCLFNSLLLDHTEGLWFAWASGLLFAGLTPSTGTTEALR